MFWAWHSLAIDGDSIGMLRYKTQVMPFSSQLERDIHFDSHGHEFGASTAEVYEKMADYFINGPLSLEARECTRPNADRIRFGLMTLKLGVAIGHQNIVKTFYIVGRHIVNRHGGSAGYFSYECGRTDL